jgi:hypothetical protein
MLHCTPTALEYESAVTLDWLLAVDDAVNRAKRNLEEAAARG